MYAIEVRQQQPRRDLGRNIPNASLLLQPLYARNLTSRWGYVIDRVELGSVVSKCLIEGGPRAGTIIVEWARSANMLDVSSSFPWSPSPRDSAQHN